MLQKIYNAFSYKASFKACAEIFMFLNSIICTVKTKAQNVGNNGFCSFFFQKTNNVVVCRRMIFNKYFANNANLRLFNTLVYFKGIESLNYSRYIFFKV